MFSLRFELLPPSNVAIILVDYAHRSTEAVCECDQGKDQAFWHSMLPMILFEYLVALYLQSKIALCSHEAASQNAFPISDSVRNYTCFFN